MVNEKKLSSHRAKEHFWFSLFLLLFYCCYLPIPTYIAPITDTSGKGLVSFYTLSKYSSAQWGNTRIDIYIISLLWSCKIKQQQIKLKTFQDWQGKNTIKISPWRVDMKHYLGVDVYTYAFAGHTWKDSDNCSGQLFKNPVFHWSQGWLVQLGRKGCHKTIWDIYRESKWKPFFFF